MKNSDFFIRWPRGLNRNAAAEYIGVSPSLFDEMVKDERMPKPISVNSRKVWDRWAIDRAFTALAGGNIQTAPADEWKVAL
jgi:predicted DNA-binding transcriptional regulator AlpA